MHCQEDRPENKPGLWGTSTQRRCSYEKVVNDRLGGLLLVFRFLTLSDLALIRTLEWISSLIRCMLDFKMGCCNLHAELVFYGLSKSRFQQRLAVTRKGR